MTVEKEYSVKLSEIDRNNEATNKAILSYLEDIGGIHSNMTGYGLLNIKDTHLSWLLLEWKLEVIKRPKYADTLKVKTWSRESIKCYAYRDFEIMDEEGNIIARAASKWVLIDIEKGRIVKIEDDMMAKYEPEVTRKAFQNENFEKQCEPQRYESEIEYVVRRADIDVNNHMHNLNYLDLLNEALPEDVYINEQLNDIRITYKKEIKLGEIVKCKYSFEGGKHIVVIKSEDDKILHAIISAKSKDSLL